jgi:hypothetical protein
VGKEWARYLLQYIYLWSKKYDIINDWRRRKVSRIIFGKYLVIWCLRSKKKKLHLSLLTDTHDTSTSARRTAEKYVSKYDSNAGRQCGCRGLFLQCCFHRSKWQHGVHHRTWSKCWELNIHRCFGVVQGMPECSSVFG